MEEQSEMPMKETGKQSSEGSAPPCEQPGTSRDTVELASQNLSCKENQVSLVPQPKKVSYSTALLSTWRDIRWFQVPLSSLRKPKTGLFSFRFQSSLQEYQQLRKTKRLKVGRPFSLFSFPSLSVTLSDCSQETLYKQHGKHSGTGRVKSYKHLSARRAAPSASVPAGPQPHLQPHRQYRIVLATVDPCDCEDRHIATAQNPVVGACGGNYPQQPCVVLHRIDQIYLDCCHWNKMSPVPPGPQHRLRSSHHCKGHRSTPLHASDICGSENSSTTKAKIPGASATQVNNTFTEPNSMQPCVLLHRISLAQKVWETEPEERDEPKHHAHQSCTEESTSMQPRVLLRRVCLAQDRRETATQDRSEPGPLADQSQAEAHMPMQPRVLLHRMSLVQDQCKTALKDWEEPRPCNNQSCAEEPVLMQPRVVLHRVCLDQCRTVSKDRGGPRHQKNQLFTEKPNSVQPRVLLHRICLTQLQCETVPQDWDGLGPSDHHAGTEELLTSPEELSSPVHTLRAGEYEAEPDGVSLAEEQPFSSASADQPPSAPPPDYAKETKLRRKGIQRHWRHSSSNLNLTNLSEWGKG